MYMKRSIGAQTVVYPTPAFVVGTYNPDGVPNGATAAWSGICCSRPPCIGVSFRKATLTYHNIIEQKAFTINVPSEHHVKETDYFGTATGKKENKFDITGFNAVKGQLVNAPYIDEFPLVLECKLLHTHELGLHTLFIGEIVDVKCEQSMLTDNGQPDVEKIKPIIFAPGNRNYYGIGNNLGQAFRIGKDLGK
jgi:flavin reductase (DIM6/NTAB) family NADH-FMN oxidoreductase RutF